MVDSSVPKPTKDRPPWWLAGGIRILLLVEGVGWWAVLGAVAFAYGSLPLYTAGILSAMIFILLGPALLCGVPAIAIALRPEILSRGRRRPAFLLVNALGAIVSGLLAFSQPEPLWYFAVISATSAGTTLLLLSTAVRAKIAA